MQGIYTRLCNGVDEMDEVVVHPRGSHRLGTSNLIVAPFSCVIVQPFWQASLPSFSPCHVAKPNSSATASRLFPLPALI